CPAIVTMGAPAVHLRPQGFRGVALALGRSVCQKWGWHSALDSAGRRARWNEKAPSFTRVTDRQGRLDRWIPAVIVRRAEGSGTRPVRVPNPRNQPQPMHEGTKMKIRPLQDRLIVKRVAEENKTKGGIINPDTAKEKALEGKAA